MVIHLRRLPPSLFSEPGQTKEAGRIGTCTVRTWDCRQSRGQGYISAPDFSAFMSKSGSLAANAAFSQRRIVRIAMPVNLKEANGLSELFLPMLIRPGCCMLENC